MGFCPYSKKMVNDVFENTNFKKEKFRNENTILKKDAIKICDFLENEYYKILNEVKKK